MNPDAVLFEIHIGQVETDTFRDTDTGTQHQRQDRNISFHSPIMKAHLVPGQSSSLFHLVKQSGHFIRFKTDNRLFVLFWQRHLFCDIAADQTGTIEIMEHFADGRELSCLAFFVVGENLAVLLVVRAIFEKLLDIFLFNLFQDGNREIMDLHVFQRRIFLFHKLEEDPQIVGVGKSRSGKRCLLNTAEKLPAEFRKIL